MMFDSRSEHTDNENRPHKKYRLVLSKTAEFNDVRCSHCGALLFRELKKSEETDRLIEIKCRRCGSMSTV